MPVELLLSPFFGSAGVHWLDQILNSFAANFSEGSFFNQVFNLRAMLALALVSLTCGAVGSMVVGSRMAFFSDALAHCAFAGVSLGYVIFELFIRKCVECGNKICPEYSKKFCLECSSDLNKNL